MIGSGVTISEWISSHAQHKPDKIAFVFNGVQRFTWQQLNDNVNRLANVMIGLGIRKGHTVASILPNSVELVEM